MDREFFNRISKQRADPSFQSAQNPAPDFYGEKVGRDSVLGYGRQLITTSLVSLVLACRLVCFTNNQITSLSTYRRWLRDQAAYNRKAMHGVPEAER
jgi:import inner membrane translocase subunit TIM23